MSPPSFPSYFGIVLIESQTVDWSNGRAVMGANESEILKMIEALPKS